MDDFEDDQNFEFPEDRINPFEFHNESGEAGEKSSSKFMPKCAASSPGGPDAGGGHAVELQPVRKAGAASPTSPGPAVKGD